MSSSNEILEPVGNKKTFFNHVFSMTEESKAEIFNTIQYSLLGVAPVVVLNKMVQRFIPEADPDKSSMEIAVEVLIQIIIMFVGVILIHRIITYLPTYSEFKYDNLSLTNVILTFLILVLSLQTKIGIKVNILADRTMELWNGSTENMETQKSSVRRVTNHNPSQGDHLGSTQSDMFPPAPLVTSRQDSSPDLMIRGNPSNAPPIDIGPMAANGVLGGSFGTSF
jgi:hypothetical protein